MTNRSPRALAAARSWMETGRPGRSTAPSTDVCTDTSGTFLPARVARARPGSSGSSGGDPRSVPGPDHGCAMDPDGRRRNRHHEVTGRRRGSVTGQEVGEVAADPSHPDLVAFHHDGRTARATITRLSRAGVDGADIELLGPIEVVTAGRYGDRQTDKGSSLALGGLVLRGLLIGMVPGALFGAVLLAVMADRSAPVLWAGAGGG